MTSALHDDPPHRTALHAPSTVPGAMPGWLPDTGEPAGFTLARLTLLLVVVISIGRVTGLPPTIGWAFLTAALVWSVVLSASAWTALAGAVVAWLLGTGFLVDRFGVLAFGSADRVRLAVVVIAAGAAVLAGRSARSRRS